MYEILNWNVSFINDDLLKVVARVRGPEGISYDSKFECVFDNEKLLFSIPLSYHFKSADVKPNLIIDEDVNHEIQHVVTKWVYKLCDAGLVTYKDLDDFRTPAETEMEAEVGENLYRCIDCYGFVRNMKLDDRVEQLSYEKGKGHYVPIPNDMELPHCEKCFEKQLCFNDHEKLDSILKALFEERDLNHKDSATLTISLNTNVYDERHKRYAGFTGVVHLDLENMGFGEISSGRNGYNDASILALSMYEITENLKKDFRKSVKNIIHHEDEMHIEALDGYIRNKIYNEDLKE